MCSTRSSVLALALSTLALAACAAPPAVERSGSNAEAIQAPVGHTYKATCHKGESSAFLEVSIAAGKLTRINAQLSRAREEGGLELFTTASVLVDDAEVTITSGGVELRPAEARASLTAGNTSLRDGEERSCALPSALATIDVGRTISFSGLVPGESYANCTLSVDERWDVPCEGAGATAEGVDELIDALSAIAQ